MSLSKKSPQNSSFRNYPINSSPPQSSPLVMIDVAIDFLSRSYVFGGEVVMGIVDVDVDIDIDINFPGDDDETDSFDFD